MKTAKNQAGAVLAANVSLEVFAIKAVRSLQIFANLTTSACQDVVIQICAAISSTAFKPVALTLTALVSAVPLASAARPICVRAAKWTGTPARLIPSAKAASVTSRLRVKPLLSKWLSRRATQRQSLTRMNSRPQWNYLIMCQQNSTEFANSAVIKVH